MEGKGKEGRGEGRGEGREGGRNKNETKGTETLLIQLADSALCPYKTFMVKQVLSKKNKKFDARQPVTANILMAIF